MTKRAFSDRASPWILGGCLLMTALAADRLRSRVTARLHKVKEQSDVYALPPPAYVQRAALGYDDAVASILWASTLYQYGAHVGQNRRFPFATQYLRTILHLDPAFRPAYRFMSTLVTMQAVAPEREELDIVRRLFKEGTEALPHDADVWGAYASFLMFEGAQYLPVEERPAWRVEGAVAAERAVELGFFINNLNLSGATYLEQAGQREVALTQLERAWTMAPNDETRDAIAARFQRMKGAARLDRVRRTQKFFADRWRDEAPFVDEGLFGLIGPRRDPMPCVGRLSEPQCAPGWSGALAADGSAPP
ncbi:MAG: hypothetical protein NVSMB1_14400 [Polyangiales bacterium]